MSPEGNATRFQGGGPVLGTRGASASARQFPTAISTCIPVRKRENWKADNGNRNADWGPVSWFAKEAKAFKEMQRIA